ncbi:polysaccharide biosynthesis protein [Wenyingzhuangia fucanilytica]|uniref:Polysaccharide biosynthesis protein n=1 Tax=Wenyingzhuangia fucanilytica TaxID=1790137 RepID=A0A1B1Y9E9_9FLAO|nr:polysaccharide biosynthesis C-terminal domain-containing protein [Wenyingzhuangia fucanilytica]ANW97376.1 polysaccharide biosynthesis protein [Wenyingzhuangia fucanilytica]
MSTLKSFLKNTFVYGLAAVLPKAVNVFLVGLHTKTLENTQQFNVNTEFFVWAAYFNVLLTFGMETTFFRFFNSEKNKEKVLSTSFCIVTLVAFLILTPLFILSNNIAPFLGFEEILHFKTLIGILLFDTLTVIPFAYLRVKNKAINYAMFRVLNISIYAILNILFLLVLSAQEITNAFSWYPTSSKVGYIFLANLFASGLTFLMVLPMFLKFKLRLDFILLKKMLAYGWPILIAGLAYVTNENLDKLILPRFLNESIAGAYAGTYKLGVFMSLFIMAFKLGAEPFFFNVSHQKNAKETYALVLKWFTILGAFIVLTIVAYIDFFAQLLLKKPEYFETLAIVPIILLANLLLGIYNNLSVWYKNTNQTKYGMYFSILGGLLTILGLLIFVPICGYMGAAWVTFFVYAIMMITSYIYGQKHYKTPYEVSKILSLFLLITLLCFISFYLLRGQIIINTILLILTFSLVFFSERNFIKQRFLKSK